MGHNKMRAILLSCIISAAIALPPIRPSILSLTHPEQHTMVNDADIISKINAHPGLTWKAGANAAFSGMPLSKFKSLNGVKSDSWGMVQSLPRHVSNLTDSVIPDSFDSATNWPMCAK